VVTIDLDQKNKNTGTPPNMNMWNDVFLLLPLARAQTAAVIRMDRTGAYSDLEPRRVALTWSWNQPFSKATKASGSAFQFIFECDATPNLCSMAQQGFESAGQRISQVLSISNTIVVAAKFHSFCSTQGGSDCKNANNTLGRASSAAFFAATNTASGPGIYYYPQALVKQLKTSESLTFARADIFAEFNSDFTFWFKSSGLPIEADQTDFEFVVSHELTHGLGMETAWVQYGSFFKGIATSSSYLAPLPFAKGSAKGNAIVSALSPLTVFDQFLSGPSGSLASFGQDIGLFNGRGMQLRSFIQAFEKSSGFSGAKKAFTSATAGTDTPLQFQPGNGKGSVVQLHSPPAYVQGTSIVHVQSSLSTSQDFLMIPAIVPLIGQKLDDILRNVKSTSIYGPGIIGIFQAMGWPTLSDPSVGSLQIVRELAGQSSSLSTLPCILTLLSIFLLFL
jgi:hypothetical protein